MLVPGVEDADEGGVVEHWPLLDGEDERILRELDRGHRKRQVPFVVQKKVFMTHKISHYFELLL